VVEHLSDYLDGELEPRILAEVETHLEECEDCQHCAEEIRATIDMIRQNVSGELPESEREGVRARLWEAIRESS
jgi:anti-sigma factor RsiW